MNTSEDEKLRDGLQNNSELKSSIQSNSNMATFPDKNIKSTKCITSICTEETNKCI